MSWWDWCPLCGKTHSLAKVCKENAVKKNTIEVAIDELKAEKTKIEQQIRLLTQALRPQAVKSAPVEPKEEKPTRATNGKKPEVNTPEHTKVMAVLAHGAPAKLGDIAEAVKIPQKRVRTLLADLVDSGKVIQHGAKRGLRFLARGVEFKGGPGHEAEA